MLKLLLNGLNVLGFSIPIISDILLYLDGLIYKIADYSLRSFFEIIRLSGKLNIGDSDISNITSRIMVLAGIFALFRLAVMLVNYIINPDKMSDLNKNGTSFIKNLIIAVVVLVLSPTIFSYMSQIQTAIIETNVIPRIIYGSEKYGENDTIESNSTKFINNIFLLFYEDNGRCYDEEGNETGNSSHACTAYRNVAKGITGITSLTWEDYEFTYTSVFSGIMGCLLVYYFLTYAVELAIRLVKLAVLQVVSPIPIIMSIDPSQKDRLTKFARIYLDIWLQAFIRILTVYMAFVVCSLIANSGGIDNIINSSAPSVYNANIMLLKINFIIKVILYIGIFQGARELPKLIDDIFGTKIGGNTHGRGFGSVLKGIVGGGIGTIGGAIAGGITGGAGGALAGAASGLYNGAVGLSAAKNAGAAIKSTIGSVKGAYATGARVEHSGGLLNYGLGAITGTFGARTASDRKLANYDKDIEKLTKAYDNETKKLNAKGSNLNNDLKGLNISQQNLEKAQNMRSGIKQKLEDTYVSSGGYRTFSEYLNNNKEYQTAKAIRDNEYNPDYKADETIRLNEMEKQLENQYNAEKNAYFEQQINNAALPQNAEPGSYNLELASMIKEYNDYVQSNGLDDRAIYDSVAYKNADTNYENDKARYEELLEAKQREIETNNEEIQKRQDAYERAKEDIEKQKDEYKKSNEYRRVHQEDAKIQPRQRNND